MITQIHTGTEGAHTEMIETNFRSTSSTNRSHILPVKGIDDFYVEILSLLDGIQVQLETRQVNTSQETSVMMVAQTQTSFGQEVLVILHIHRVKM
ncbi:MAG: hypothetical protein R2883_00165 [Caldisericia bacterium]